MNLASLVGICLATIACNGTNSDPAIQCPRAVKLGIAGPGLIPCDVLAARDRRDVFLRTNQLMATCTGDTGYLSCSGVTKAGAPIKFKCDTDRCEWIPQWLW